MFKHFIPILFLSLASPFLYAQKPDFIKVEPFVGTFDDRAMCNNNAGSSTQTLSSTAQSNDKTYLCKNDVLNIKHNGSSDLSSDPVPSTKPGLGYAFYTCKPTVSGTMLSQIVADPCIFKGNPGSPPANGLFVTAQGKLDGNQSFLNNGSLQSAFNSGKPIKFTFAPITFDALNASKEVVYEGTPSGFCVNVNTAASFDVVYLNAINSSIVNQGNGTGSFKLFGGLPEYTTSENYSVTIQSAIGGTGTITSGPAKHGGTVVFTGPNGVYTVTVEDGKSCGTTFNITLSAAFDIVAVGDTICDAATPKKGSFGVVPSGGTAPFSYVWQEVSGTVSSSIPLALTGSVINNLDPGNYSITATDGAGLTKVKTVKIIESKDVTGIIYSATLSESDPKCPKSLDGSMTANVVGGFPPFFYQWDNDGGIGKNTITDLGVGTYNVTITDNIGCAITRSSGLSSKQITIANQIIKNSTCSGVADGEISITAGGGTSISGNYKFNWAAPINLTQTVKTSTIPNLKEGKYCVTITDDNGCESDFCYDVLPGKVLSITPQITDIKCFGDKSGKISLQGNTANGAAASPYIFQYSQPIVGIPISGTATTGGYEQLPAGKYSVTMTDQDGCSVSLKDIEVKEPSELKILSVAVSDPTCAGAAKDGFIEVKAEGGTLAAGNNYKYKWDNNAFTPKVTGLIAGDYGVTVTDDNGCVLTRIFTLNPPASPKITAVAVKNVDCSNSTNGSIKITATPASAGDVLIYNWSASGKNGAEIFDLPPTKYSVTVTDQKGCTTTIDTAVTSPAPLALVDSIITKPICTGDKNGSITLEMKGGTPSYKFLWNQDNVTKEVSGLNKGTLSDLAGGVVYTISVEDSKGCKGTSFSIFLPQPTQIKVAFSDKKDITCVNSGKSDGEVKCTVKQGNIPNAVYSFTWSNNNTDTGTESFENELPAGMARVTVSDGVCSIVDSVLIGSPAKVGLDSAKLQVTNVSCFGLSDGSISVQGIGGVAPYTYLWENFNNATTPTISGLAAMDYTIIITDNNKCPFLKSITVASPDKLNVKLDSTLPNPTRKPSCAGYSDGVIKLLVTGGNAPYSFEWTNTNATNNIATKLIAGKYKVIITDQKGCQTTLQETLDDPLPIKFTIDTILAPICFGYLTDVKIKSASGGTGSMLGNYTFTIDDGGDANAKDGVIPVYAGKHSVKLFDPDGCFFEQTIEIKDPPAIKVYLGPDVELELGDSYEINAVIEATAPLIKYDWSPTIGLTFSDSCKNDCARLIKPLEDGSFILLVTDTIGCMGADTINISIDRNRNVYLPNIFSPNVDGTNDFMEVFADPESVENINYFRIFDRWGNLVFESNSFKPSDSKSAGNRWDGFYQGIKANTGTYTYVCEVKFVDNVVLRFRGDVSLVR